MIDVRLPGRVGYLCGTCATFHRRRHQVRRCCAPSDFEPGDYVLLTVSLGSAAFFLGIFLPQVV